jgi:hypothetical protein
MAFVNKLPSEEDIVKYDLPFKLDLEKPIEHRRSWLTDRERDIHMTGPGATGNPAFEDKVKMRVSLYLGRCKIQVILEPPKVAPGGFKANPYYIHWPALLEIWVIHPQEQRMIEVLQAASKNPDKPEQLLQGHSLRDFVEILKEALSARKEGDSTHHIQAPITVTFGF